GAGFCARGALLFLFLRGLCSLRLPGRGGLFRRLCLFGGRGRLFGCSRFFGRGRLLGGRGFLGGRLLCRGGLFRRLRGGGRFRLFFRGGFGLHLGQLPQLVV